MLYRTQFKLHATQKQIVWIGFTFISSLLFQNCAPVFSEMQGARLVSKGQVEATGLYSNVGFAEGGGSDHIQNHVGARIAYGLSDNLNIRIGYENIFEDGQSGHVLGVGAKFPVIKDRIAFYLPVGTAFGSDITTSDNWQTHPTVLFTVPVVENIEFNPSAKWLIPFNGNQDNLVAVNFGAAVSTDINKWALRPEIGLLYNPGEGGHFTHYSLGFSFYPLFEDNCCPQKLRKNR